MLRLKKGFVLRSVAGRTVVITDGEILNLNLMIGLNDTGKFLWELAEKGTSENEMVSALLKEYDVEEADAKQAVQKFVSDLQKNGFLEES